MFNSYQNHTQMDDTHTAPPVSATADTAPEGRHLPADADLPTESDDNKSTVTTDGAHDAAADQPTVDTPESDSGRTTDDAIEQAVAAAVDRAFDRLSERLRQAEEQGYRRAVETARSHIEAEDRRQPSVPNFLLGSRPDIWER